MYNLSISYFSDSLSIRFYDNFITHDKKKPVKYFDVPFTDTDGSPLKGRPLGENETFESKREESIRCSLSRTRSRIRHICRSFSPTYFFTFTFSSDFVDRYDYDLVSKYMSLFLRRLPDDVQYIIVPEKHQDGAFHFHGLFSDNFPCDFVGKYRVKQKNGSWSVPKDTFHACNFPWGFTAGYYIKSHTAVSFYISKYITKDIISLSKGKKRYWYSKSNINLNNKFNFAISIPLFQDLYELLQFHFFENGKVFRCENNYCKFKEFQIPHQFFKDILDFCSYYDDGSSSIYLC